MLMEISDTTPRHYRGTSVTAASALESMMGACEGVPNSAAFWWGLAFKYVWRWPLKDGLKDVDKAIDCLERLKAAMER